MNWLTIRKIPAGKVIIPIGSANDAAFAVAVQPDNKIVVAGTTSGNNRKDFALTRRNSDGSADNSFGSDGKIITSITPDDDQIYAITLGNGRIIAAGSTGEVSNSNPPNLTKGDFAVVRYWQ